MGCKLYAISTGDELGSGANAFREAGVIIEQIQLINHKGFWGHDEFDKRLDNYVKKEGINYIHCQYSLLSYSCSKVAHKNGIKAILSVNNMFETPWYKKPVHMLLRYINKNIFDCKYHSGSDTVYKHEFDFWHNKTDIVYWWYDENNYYPATDDEKIKARIDLNIPEDAFVIITAGGCADVKRHDDIIKAVKILSPIIPNLLFLHLGKGELETYEKDLATTLEVSQNIRFCGVQSEYRKYLIASDVYTMTSRKEGLSNATIDALACKIPAVLYHVVGLCDYNIDGENTIQVSENPEELAKGIEVLYNSKETRKEYAEKGYKLVTRKYQSKNNVYDLYNKYYS